MQDRIHQPYRQTLIPGYEAVRAAALGAGAYGVAISGAGPTLIALADTAEAVTVATAMSEAWQARGITTQQKVLQIDAHGARSAVDSVSLSS
jgi:homoserine kinase